MTDSLFWNTNIRLKSLVLIMPMARLFHMSMARKSGHSVVTGLGVVGVVYIDIQLWKFIS